MNADEVRPGALETTEPQRVGHLQDKAETSPRQDVLILTAAAIGILPDDLRRLDIAGARALCVMRLREIEGTAELLGRQTDALEGFCALLGRAPADVRYVSEALGRRG